MTASSSSNSQNLYRIVSFDRAVQIIQERKLYFAHPSTWDDPYERVLQHERAHSIFAQCWCRKALSDAMWRIYSPHGLGVRLGTTKQRLSHALSSIEKSRNIRYSIQNVEYLYQEELDFKLNEVRDKLATDYTFVNATKPLFLKRRAFDHEKETRVVVLDRQCKPTDGAKGITVDVDPFQVLSSIWIDPRAPAAFVDAYTHYLKDKLGFPGTVDKSRLYVVPNHLSVGRDES